MRRKLSKTRKNTTHTIKTAKNLNAKRSRHTLEAQLSILRSQVAELQNQVAELRAASGFTWDLAKDSKRRGPKPKHDGMMIRDRDQLVQMLEYYWPEIEPLTRHPNSGALKSVLTAIRKQTGSRYEQPAMHLLRQLPELIKFLLTDRFRRDPRQIANALAGVPLIGIWRSLKVCQANPCNIPIGDRALRTYICRKHPQLYRTLIANDSLPHFASALRDYRTSDAKMRSFTPLSLYHSWKAGVANYPTLGLNSSELSSHERTRPIDNRGRCN
jgi:hypothetical protein